MAVHPHTDDGIIEKDGVAADRREQAAKKGRRVYSCRQQKIRLSMKVPTAGFGLRV
ncbi:hypothetical protein [Sediminibacillus sp. JSM 1682029]|uniref:hypothetical protein n=1 Tax=Sediminibacillus sp. JSM 1682029 TaxID=3229857 RepID=UPI000409E813